MIKLSKKWIIIIVVAVLVVGYFAQKSLLKSPTEGLVMEKVEKGEVSQEVSETGSVKATQNINLSFKSIGKIARINVAVGDSVEKGSILAELDKSYTLAQLQSAQAALIYATNSGVDLARENLRSAYESALNTLSDAYTKVYNAYSAVTDLQNTYFVGFDQNARDAKTQIQSALVLLESSLGKAKNSGLPEEIDSALSVATSSLNTVSSALKIIRDTLDEIYYYGRIPDSEKTAIDTQKANINTALANLASDQNSISSYKIALEKAEGSTVEQAQADVDALQSQLNDNYLISPIDGVITEVNVKRGQVVSSSQSVINLLSSEPFQIKAAIYEQDIINVKVGDNVKINLVAFPRQIFDGKVLSINPAETIIDNVVYYEVAIDFPNQPVGIKSGMTADITIQTNKKDDVLRISKNTVLQIEGAQTVQVFKNGKIENVEITTGLEGNDYYEVLSGLSEDDTIITGKQ